MRLNKQNIVNLPINQQNRDSLSGLLTEVDDINNRLYPFSGKKITVDFQDYHNEYSPERVDPCPDYFGYYRIYLGNEQISPELTLSELDDHICTLLSFLEEL